MYQQAPAMPSASPSVLTARLDEEVISFATDLFSALAHPTRLRIIELLTASERTVNEIAHELDILQPNTSQHLAILQRAGVVKVTPRGALRSYSIRAPRMNQILLLVDELRASDSGDQQIGRDGNGTGNRSANGDGQSRTFTMRDGHGHRDGNGSGSPARRVLQPRRDGHLDGHAPV